MRDKQLPVKGSAGYTVKVLGLNVEAAREGKTWLLLPEAFRDCGATYPLPTSFNGLQTLKEITIPNHKMDSGCIYLRRAHKAFSRRANRTQSAVHDVGRRADRIVGMQYKLEAVMKKCKQDARDAVDDVKKEAMQAVASLTDLFSLGRRGLEGQMQAHLDHKEWQGEEIDSKAFRDCVRIVTATVKGLGLPDPQRKDAAEGIMKQVAEALRETKSAISLSASVSDSDETKH